MTEPHKSIPDAIEDAVARYRAGERHDAGWRLEFWFPIHKVGTVIVLQNMIEQATDDPTFVKSLWMIIENFCAAEHSAYTTDTQFEKSKARGNMPGKSGWPLGKKR